MLIDPIESPRHVALRLRRRHVTLDDGLGADLVVGFDGGHPWVGVERIQSLGVGTDQRDRQCALEPLLGRQAVLGQHGLEIGRGEALLELHHVPRRDRRRL